MSGFLRSMMIGLTVVALAFPTAVGAGFGDMLKGVAKTFGGGGATDSDIVAGLRQALEIGTEAAVTSLSAVDGYYGNPQVKIPLPPSVLKMESVLRATGFGGQLDAFELTMNRAAEKAAPEAKALFWDAIGGMSFADAKKILNGREDEATRYFREKTSPGLTSVFKPIVGEAVDSVGVTRTYKDLNDRISTLPFAQAFSVDLDDYVTRYALDGLFVLIAEEEANIRRDPSARVTELLKKVFSKQ